MARLKIFMITSISLRNFRAFQAEAIRVQFEVPRQPVRKESVKGRFVIAGRVPYSPRVTVGRHEVIGFVGNAEIFKKNTRNLGTTGFLRFSRRSDSVPQMVETIA